MKTSGEQFAAWLLNHGWEHDGYGFVKLAKDEVLPVLVFVEKRYWELYENLPHYYNKRNAVFLWIESVSQLEHLLIGIGITKEPQ